MTEEQYIKYILDKVSDLVGPEAIFIEDGCDHNVSFFVLLRYHLKVSDEIRAILTTFSIQQSKI